MNSIFSIHCGAIRRLLAAAAIASLPSSAGAAAIIQWTGPGSNGHYYSVTDTTSTWTEANSLAISLGGYLASVTSAAENDFLQASFFPAVSEAFWIGLTDEASEGNFVWTSGESLSYTNWGPGEPNNSAPFWSPSGENYTAINWPFSVGINGAARGTWNDTPVNGTLNGNVAPQLYRAIIEYNVPEPSQALLLLPCAFLLSRRRTCR